jgi:hypothetical protein
MENMAIGRVMSHQKAVVGWPYRFIGCFSNGGFVSDVTPLLS